MINISAKSDCASLEKIPRKYGDKDKHRNYGDEDKPRRAMVMKTNLVAMMMETNFELW